MSFWKWICGQVNECQSRDEEGKTCLDRQKGNILMCTCDYCYAVGSGLIKDGDWI
jgi:hypothetical protein